MFRCLANEEHISRPISATRCPAFSVLSSLVDIEAVAGVSEACVGCCFQLEYCGISPRFDSRPSCGTMVQLSRFTGQMLTIRRVLGGGDEIFMEQRQVWA